MEYFYIKELKIPLYRGRMVIIFTNDTVRLKKHIPSFNDEYIYAHTLLTNWKGEQGFIIVLNFKSKYREIHNGTITHESIHAADFIAQERGIVPDFSNDEPIAYLAGYITDEIYKLMDKYNFKAISK